MKAKKLPILEVPAHDIEEAAKETNKVTGAKAKKVDLKDLSPTKGGAGDPKGGLGFSPWIVRNKLVDGS